MLAALTGELGHYWQGPASAVFQQQWAAQYRSALVSAASTLAEMHTHLLANIEQQIQASSADTGLSGAVGVAGGLGLASILGGIGRAWQVAEKIDGYGSLVTDPIDLLKKLDEEGALTGLRDTQLLHWLQDSGHLRQAEELLSRAHVPVVLDVADKVGTGMSYISIGVSGASAIHDLAQHHYSDAGGEAIDGTATGLKSTGDPVLYLAGFDISLLKKDYELGRQIQWTDIPNPLNASNFENDYIPAFKSLPGELISTLAEL